MARRSRSPARSSRTLPRRRASRRSARRARARRRAIRSRLAASSASRRSASASASASPGGDQLAVDPVAQDVAIARDVGRDNRRGRRERLRDDHAKALAAQRRRAEHVGARQLGELALLGHLAQRSHRAIVEHHVRDLLGARADQRERRRHVVAQRLERPQQDREPLAFNGLADEHDPQRARPLVAQIRSRSCGSRRSAPAGAIGRGQVNAVGHDPVAPAEEAPSRPRRRLGHGDAHAQVVHPPPTPERRGCDPVGQRVLGVRVKRADQRQLARAEQRVPADQRNDRLVEVDGVIAALAQLAAQREDRVRPCRDVRDRAVGGDPDRAPQRDEALGLRRAPAGAPRGAGDARARRRGHTGARMRTSWSCARSSPASDSMWRVTPPGYVHEYGDTSAIRTAGHSIPRWSRSSRRRRHRSRRRGAAPQRTWPARATLRLR